MLPQYLKMLAIPAFGIASLSTVHASLIFSDDFDTGNTLGSNPVGWTSILGNTEGTNSVLVQEDTGNLFGQGTSNRYVDLWDNSTNPGGQSIYLTVGGLSGSLASGVATLNMNIIEPAGVSSGRILIGIGEGTMAGTDRANNINYNEGNYGGETLATDTLYNLNVVFNNSASSIQYNSTIGLQTLDAESADIWVDGSLVQSNVTQDRTWDGGVAIDAVGFRSFSGDIQRLLVDDFSVYSDARVVPEPASAPLLIGLVASVFALRRRKLS